MSAPQSMIHICSGVRLNSRYEHSIYFASASAQASFFAGKVVKTYSAYTFLRKSWPLKVEATMVQAKTWSYLFFQNGASSKVYYYFINNVEYLNDHTVQLDLELDVLQTYMFDYTLLPSFVERQHVEDDTVGLHTQEEGLDPGEYQVQASTLTDVLNDWCILVLTSSTVTGTSAETVIDTMGFKYNNVFCGMAVYAIPLEKWVAWADRLLDLSEWGKIDSIVAMWMYPKKLVNLGGEATWDNAEMVEPVNSAVSTTVSVGTAQTGALDGYTPKNNKLYCYPYNFLYATNHNGASAVYRYERFNGSPSFQLSGAIAPDAGVRLTPQNYNGVDSYPEGLTLPAYPTCAWDADGYKIWLAQNSNAHDLAMTQGQLKVACGALTGLASFGQGNVFGAAGGAISAYSGYAEIQALNAAKEDKAVEPPQARGVFSASLNMVNERHCFGLERKTVTAEYARRIDDFFTLYGYKINQVKTPNRHARKAFTYVKTIGCHIAANLCNEDTIKIESIFDKGITWWADGDKIGNYTQDNATL